MQLREKDPDVPATYYIDVRLRLIDEPYRRYSVAQGAFVRAQRDTGFYYEATAAGVTAQQYPTWPRAAGETVQDGSVQWTARHPDNATLPTVSSATWTLPSGITLDSQVLEPQLIRPTFSGGVDGEDYSITVRVTPSAGNSFDMTFTLPVRAQ